MTVRRTLSRRALIAGGAATLVAVPALTVLGLRGTGSPEEIVVGYLRRMLPGLAVPDAEMYAFAAQYLGEPATGWRNRMKYERTLLLMAQPALADAAPASIRGSFEWTSRDVMTTFLFSTDFFTNAGARPERTAYVAYADPYAVGCRNPLSRKGVDA